MATKRIELTVDEALLARLDRERGMVPRAAWIKAAIESHLSRDVLTKLVQDGPGLSDGQMAGGWSVKPFSDPVVDTPKGPRPRSVAQTWAR